MTLVIMAAGMPATMVASADDFALSCPAVSVLPCGTVSLMHPVAIDATARMLRIFIITFFISKNVERY